MSKANTDPVLIVGAGPTGLIAALSLAKHGVPVRVVEKLPAFHTATRGTGAHARSLEIYHFLGVLDDYLRVAEPLPEMRSYELPGGTEPLRTWKLWVPSDVTPDRPILGNPKIMLGQYGLEGIFRDHLAKHGVEIELDTELVDLEQGANGVKVTLRKDGDHTEEASVAYVIGTDGARGVTRKLIGAKFEGVTKEADGQVWADVEVEGLSPQYWHLWSQPDKFTITMRANGDSEGHYHVGIIGINYDPVDLTDPEKFMNFIFENTGRRDLKFKNLRSLSYWKPKIRMVNKFYLGRVFIAGDAAHIHAPTGGQGLNASIQDSFNLAWKLALVYKGLATSQLLSSYEAERLPVVAEILANTTALYNHIVPRNGEPAKEVKNDKTAFLQWRNQALAQLEINYRWSPIVVDAKGKGIDEVTLKARAFIGYPGEEVHAGDRAPDAPGLTNEFGQETRIHDILNPTCHLVLIFAPEADDADEEIDSVINTCRSLAPEGTVQTAVLARHAVPKTREGTAAYHDTNGHAFGAYHVEEGKVTVVAVRPDTYIGAFVYDAAGLQTYFSRIFRSA
ncbi:FAD binding domain-containing protein [Trametes punicea]|nr:FAD binding domain-containing protein [Trametes punicea]